MNHQIAFATGFQEVQCLMYYDCPVLSHYRDDKGVDYIMIWADVEENVDFCHVIEISAENLIAYKNNEITARQVIELSPAIWYCTGQFIRGMDNIAYGERIAQDDIPESRRPTADSYLKPKEPITDTEQTLPVSPDDAESMS